ncbi:MAG: hypothetical protein HQM08_30930 [Candidatus Riflebacteria bacterium]|nr:hypothetical protein [Candidatus Riflebacteria bacterium]
MRHVHCRIAAGCGAACNMPRGAACGSRSAAPHLPLSIQNRQNGSTKKQAPFMPPHHIPIAEAARRYGVNRSTIQRKIAKGELERIALKNGKVGVTLKSLEAAFGTPPQGAANAARTEQDAAPSAACRAAPRAAAASAALPSNAAAAVATLRAELAAAVQRQTDIEEMRRQVVQAQNEHIDSLRKELEQKARELEAANQRAEAAHLENMNLHHQLADARRHETERGRLAAPSPASPAIVIEGMAADQPAGKPTRRRIKARRSDARPAPATKPEPSRPWWRLFG